MRNFILGLLLIIPFMTISTFAINWDNNNFLDDSFWNQNPTDSDIVNALYGDGSGGTEKTIYTQNWTDLNCVIGDMSVTYLTEGLPITLSENTIYVLGSGNYTNTGTINVNNCSAILGSTGTINLYSSIYLTDTTKGLLNVSNKKNIIFDNINIDGINDGIGGSHSINSGGIFLGYSSFNISLHNIDVYNNYIGIYFFDYTNHTTLDSVNTYNNNGDGISFWNRCINNFFNNIESYNNLKIGIQLNGNSRYNTFDNISTYGNSLDGFRLWGSSNENIVTNLTSYGNKSNGGIIMGNSVSGNVLSGIIVYNNTGTYGGIYIENSTYNTFINIQTHDNSSYGFRLNAASRNIFNNIKSYNNPSHGFYHYNSSNNSLNNIEISDNGGNGLYLYGGSYNTVTNSKTYKCGGRGLYLYNSLYNTINELEIFENQSDGIYLRGNYNTFNNIKLYNNDYDGITTYSATYNILNNIETYNNGGYGIDFYYNSSYNKLNNIQSYNNDYGIEMYYNSSYNALNNIQSYNNDYGLYLGYNSNYNIFNNIQSYNNTYGLYINNSSGTIMNDISFKNNGFGLYNEGLNSRFYGYNIFSENNISIDGTESVITGNMNDFSILGWTGGSIETNSGYFHCGDTTNPFNINNGFLNNTGTYGLCNSRGQISEWIPQTGENIGYLYGSRINKQIQPVQYSGTSIILSTLEYSGDLYIGEFNKIGENIDNDYGLSCQAGDYSVSWNNNNFLDETFWNQNPNSCDIVSALYGTGEYGADKTAYTTNRNGVLCDVRNMEVVSGIQPGTNVLINQLSANTIYILNPGTYITDQNINTNGCTTIIIKNNTGYFYSNQSLSEIFNNKGSKGNNILERININGIEDGQGGSHTENNYGIYFSEYNSNNTLYNIETYNNGNGIYLNTNSDYNTLNNIESYKNSGYGIYTDFSNYNILSNIKSYNNTGMGIYLYYGKNNGLSFIDTYNNNNHGLYVYGAQYNNFNNIKSYKNSGYGMYFVNMSDYHTIKNIQNYSNSLGGLYIDSLNSKRNNIQNYNNSGAGLYINSSSSNKTNYNSLNNVQSYNNEYGIYLKTCSGNIFNNISVYNNNYGLYFYNSSNINRNILNNINIYNNNTGIYLPVSVTENYIYNNFNVFANNSDIDGYQENLILGTGDYSHLGWTDGNINTGGSMSWNIITNPKNNSGEYLLPRAITSRNDIIGPKFFIIDSDVKFSYGTDIPKQTQPIIYSGTALVFSGEYDGQKYIGSDIIALTGYLDGWTNTGSSSVLDVNVLATPLLKYTLLGDVYYINSGIVNTPTSIILSLGAGLKTVITQLQDDNNFATHFANMKTYVSADYVTVPSTIDEAIIKNEFIIGGFTETEGSVKGLLPGYLIGDKNIILENSDGKIGLPLVVQSTGVSNKIEVQLSSGTILKTDNNSNYTGIFQTPYFKGTGISFIPDTISVVSFGSDTTSLKIKDEGDNLIPATIRIPVAGVSVGKLLDIYYSENNGETWIFHTKTNVMSFGGLPYIETTTTHFTDFAISENIGSFTINNDDSNTITQEVTLNINAPGITNMRFKNESGEWTDWIPNSTGYLRTLSDGEGIKTVYADFDIEGDGTGDITDISDSIIYNHLFPRQKEGQLTLEILSGASECVYGTSLNLGNQNVKLNEAYSFSGTFTGDRYCADFVGNNPGWVFTIEVGDLNNGNGGVISGSNLLISHAGTVTQGDSSCTGSNGIPSQFSTPYTLIEKSGISDKICRVTLSDVNIEINVPSNQAPGSYDGTLTIYVPNF